VLTFKKVTKNFTSVCITDTGALGGKLLGIVTSRDIDFINDRLTPLEEVMTRDVVTAQEGVTPQAALEQLKKSKMGRLPIVTSEGDLVGLATR
jgi:IMP dehydrogenase